MDWLHTFLHYLRSIVAAQLDEAIGTVHYRVAGNLSVAKHEIWIWNWLKIDWNFQRHIFSEENAKFKFDEI